jgi:F5/8 type C domain
MPKRTNISSATVIRGSGSFSYSVETSSDGSTWRTVATAPASSPGTDQLKFSPTQAQFVRLDFPGGSGASTPDIDEFSISGH